MVSELQENIKVLQQSLDLAAQVYGELRELLVKTTHEDASVVINGLQQVKAVYSEKNLPLEVYQDIFLNIVDACNMVLDYAVVNMGRKISVSTEKDIQIHPNDRYAAKQDKVTVLFDGKAEFVSISVEGESEMDEFLSHVVIALNDALKDSLTEASKRLADIAGRG